MFLSNRRLAVFLLFCFLTACAGQVVILSAAPHPQSLRSISHAVRHRIAVGFHRHFHGHANSAVTIKTPV